MRSKQVILLVFFSLLVVAQADQRIFSNCVSGTFLDYCIDVDTDDSCTILNGTFSIGDQVYESSFDISSLLGAGEQDWLCEPSLGDSCTACWSINGVEVLDDVIQSCYKLTIECDGVLVYRNTRDLGCASATNCEEVVGCPNDCHNNGDCNENGYCECNEGFYGADCSTEINWSDGCFADANTASQICLDAEQATCNEIDIFVSSYSQDPQIWRVTISDVLNVYTSRHFEYQVNEECTAMLSLSHVASSPEAFTTCVNIGLGCIGETQFELACFNMPTSEECIDDATCFYDSEDPTIITEGETITIPRGEWNYFALRSDFRDPVADISLSVSLHTGEMTGLVREGCRPTESIANSGQNFSSHSHPIDWYILDDCNGAISTVLQRKSLYYFGFQCYSEDEECSFTYQLSVHAIATVTVNTPVHRPLWERTGYQLFQMFPGRDLLEFQLHLTYSDDYEAAASLYLQSGNCATKYEYFAFQMTNSSEVNMRGQITLTYLLTIDPLALNLVGVPIEVTVYTSASCMGQVQCGYWELAVFYSDASDASLPYESDNSYSSDISATALPNYSDSYEASGTGVPYYTDSYITTDESTALPYHSNSYEDSDTGLPYNSDSYKTTYESTGLPNYSDSYKTSEFPMTTRESSEIPSVHSATEFPGSSGSEETRTDEFSSFPHSVDVSATEDSNIVAHSSEKSSDKKSSTAEGSNEDSGSSLLYWILGGVGSAVGIVGIMFVIIFIFVYKVKQQKSKFEIGFDDDGLLLGDSDFEL